MGDPLKMSSVSLEYVRAKVEATENGVQVDPTGGAAEFAFMSDNSEPSGGDWETGSWETDPAGPTYYARILVGPSGDVTLADGKYKVWLRISDNPEIPVRRVGVLTIT